MLRFSLPSLRHFAARRDNTARLVRAKIHRVQASKIPQRLGISFGSDSRPIAFLPRQPCEDDISIFPEGAARATEDSPVVDFDHEAESAEAAFDEALSLPSRSTSSPATTDADRRHLQIPIARLETPRLGLPAALLQKLKSKEIGISHLTPVQAKMLQRAFLLHDCAVSAETGSGKTYGLCIALLAKLLRNGPNRAHSALFLVPSDILVHQVATWITQLWPYENDKRDFLSSFERSKLQRHGVSPPVITNSIVATIYNSEKPKNAYNRVISSKIRVPSQVIVAAPEIFWQLFLMRKSKFENTLSAFEWEKKEIVRDFLSAGGKNTESQFELGYRTKASLKTQIRPIFSSIDTVVVDEADAVLPADNLAAAGNLLLGELTNPVRFKSPLQLLINSATLTPTTVSHLRRFLRKNVFASTTSRIFEGDSERERQLKREEMGGAENCNKVRKTNDNNFRRRTGYGTTTTTTEEAAGGAGGGAGRSQPNSHPSPALQLSPLISHRFMAADDDRELIHALIRVAEDFRERYVVASKSPSNATTKTVIDHDDDEELNKESAETFQTTNPTITRQLESKIFSVAVPPPSGFYQQQTVDENGYAIIMPETAATNDESEKVMYGQVEAEVKQDRKHKKEHDEQIVPQQQLSENDEKPSRNLPKLLIIYPEELKFMWNENQQKQEENEERFDTKVGVVGDNNVVDVDHDGKDKKTSGKSETKNFFEEKSRDVVVCGGLTSMSQLEVIVEEIFFPPPPSSSSSSSSPPQVGEEENCLSNNTCSNTYNYEVIMLSSEQVRGFDDKNVKVVVILSRADSVRDFVHWSGRVGRMGHRGEAVHVLSRTWMRKTAEYCERLGLTFKVHKG